MQQWEHKFSCKVTLVQVRDELVEAQKDGWELISTHRYKQTYDRGMKIIYYDLFFKRPKEK